ncbi:hypothetical protein [Legionella oakridgensis]|uniref:Uncharacterized protein n=2 Tax=Legionella oakridgensis TaxID=29423 RepID=W0B9Y6_9GAMM|nr:hypothetical protein [Legionella oakridgensis]AHE67328.1 hypothetical protein Loa_01781 [Legionella oakridgensis ATCC 33761 = DSM 21215]ETO93078.1 hypothetical protein LOR_75c21770 [Legionella oakridgensis RV-2-2007]KTD37886.1 hypothetical protein Loak_1562 [Legionella oakridgensis]STY20392.1 Uncharacterised protein [Legionella longbeachae]
MKKVSMILIIGCFSKLLFAGSGCGYFNVSLENYTGYPCAVLAATVRGGNITGGGVPQYVGNGEMMPSFQMQQGFFSGPKIQLDLQCGNKTVTLFSQQNYCFLEAGNVSGDVSTPNNIHAKYIAANGSYWYSRPGSIVWTIF